MVDKFEKEKLIKTINLIDANIDVSKKQIQSNESNINQSLDFFYNDKNYFKDSSDKNLMEKEISLSSSNRKMHLISLKKLLQMKQNPYFGRVDFKNKWGENNYYFGLGTLNHEDDIQVHDWRTPIANLYYNGDLGQSTYQAPMGVIEGEITFKRQYKFEQGQLKLCVDTTLTHDDQMLIDVLNNNNVVMKNIVNTIQKEQNLAIRYKDNTDLLILGVAGSGKTSIALHRVAYLMYKDALKYENANLALISPNEIFSKYIDNVLPSLGEKNIISFCLNDIVSIVLKKELKNNKISIESKENYYERIVNNHFDGYFADLNTTSKLDDFIKNYVDEAFNKKTRLRIGEFSIKGENLFYLYNDNFKTKNIFTRKKLIIDHIKTLVKNEMNLRRLSKEVIEVINKFADRLIKEPNYLELTKDFIKGLGWEKQIIQNKVLLYEYLYTLVYIKIRLKECNLFDHFNHLLIDEIQDLTYLEFKALSILFSCKKTLLGDLNQKIIDNDYLSGYNNADKIILNNSYRSTINIFNFLNKIIYVENVKALDRKGGEPKVIGFETINKEKEYLIKTLKEYSGRSLILITKNNDGTNRWYKLLKNHVKLNKLGDSQEGLKGILVGSVYMVKGLEFQDVIVLEADEENYKEKLDINYLYVACSRAISTLTVLYVGKITKYLKNEMGKKI